MKYITLSAVIITELMIYSSSSYARIIDDWPYEKLFSKSDLVVLATAVKTEAATDKWSPYPSSWPYEFAAQCTTFKVTLAIKGSVQDEQVIVLHFKFGELKKGLDPNSPIDTVIENGPMFVTFPTKAAKVDVGKDQETLASPEYLLFLRKGLDGRYEPVSGRIDPAFSVKEVHEASSSAIKGR